ncbi:MAG: sulfatase-like hydrolase/transferase, partial [Candidatus Aenigmarchaeota archaeon]|nr:sulfatase-like hydrolase/transferase [Candidatus Aenigmarchaeota archaeon]
MMNLIFITMDGLRRDRVAKVPSLAALAKESLFFSGVITAAPYTVASMHALFSGTYPSRNGVNAYFNMFKFDRKFKTLAEYMKDAGLFCRADVINDSVLPRAGFDVFEIHDENKDNLTERHCRILEEIKNKKSFFLYLHYSNIHTKLIRDVQKPYNDFSKEFFSQCAANEKRYDSYMKGCEDYLK